MIVEREPRTNEKNLLKANGGLKKRDSPIILKGFLEEALQAEMDGHLADADKGREAGNKRNGRGQKTVKTSHGEVTIETPQDRHSNFQPQIVEKRQRILADNLEKQIIAMYGMGNKLRDISAQIKEMYDTDISTQVLSDITDRVIPKIKEEEKVRRGRFICGSKWTKREIYKFCRL